jgi:hypothetical protein
MISFRAQLQLLNTCKLPDHLNISGDAVKVLEGGKQPEKGFIFATASKPNSEARPVSYPKDTGNPFPEDKEAGA